jgi:hypothetical protein
LRLVKIEKKDPAAGEGGAAIMIEGKGGETVH